MAKHQYPGVNLPAQPGLIDRDNLIPIYPIGLSETRGCNSRILAIREVAMMMLMDKLTDKPNWHEKVFDEAIVQKWREEARTQSENGLFVRIIEGKWLTDRIPKPESRIISEKAFDYCIAELRNKAEHFALTGLIPTLDSDGNTVVKSDTVITDALRDELREAFETLRADQAANVDWHPRSNDMVQNLVHPSMYPFIYGRSRFLDEEQVGIDNALDFVGKGRVVPEITTLPDFGGRFRNYVHNWGDDGVVPAEYRSSLYQWLPTNVAFRQDGKPEITSYINNLHPGKYPAIYKAIEHAIEVAIPAWEQCLRENFDPYTNGVAGREDTRLDPIAEANDDDDDFDTLWKVTMKFERPHSHLQRRRYRPAPKPSVGESLMYGEWVQGREALLPEPRDFESIDYAPKHGLHGMFWEHGLQVIVKMASIELTPEKPEFSTGSWHVEGQMNERICATALFYLDSENITDSHLSFRMQTSDGVRDEMEAAQDQYNYLERVYGTTLGNGSPCLQNYGDVRTPQGRLLAFPNVFQHRVSSFRLKDATKPGHRRFLALWLVDPHERIVSTANVPPQQKDWWMEASNGASVPESLMTVEEAKEHRLKLMDERSRYEAQSEQALQRLDYNFCEH